MTVVAPLARPGRVGWLGRLGRRARVLRLEIRRSVVPWAIPLIAALFFFDAFRTAVGFAPVWTVRSSVITSNMITDFGPFAAGLAAWVASREGRRHTGDLLATTVRPAWARQAAALGGTLFWLLLAFLIGVAALYIDTARQATWGGPPVWPVVVGVVEVTTFAVIGFAVGALFPGRFAAPLAAIGTFVLAYVGFHAALGVTPLTGTYALLSPATAVPLGDDGVFYHVAPDVAIVQVMFMGGICVALAAVVVLAPLGRVSFRGTRSVAGRASRWLLVTGAALLAAGVAASSTAFALAGTAKVTLSGWDIPALHDAASDQPVPYTPDCAGTSFKVCLHPAFSIYLRDVNAVLQPVAAEIAGLPGAPVRAEQVASGSGVRTVQGLPVAGTPATGITGTPPVYNISSEDPIAPLWGNGAMLAISGWGSGFAQEFLTSYVSPPNTFMPTPAQQAVVTALMAAAGVGAPQFPQAFNGNGTPAGASQAQIGAAASRFQALPAAARRAWLTTHLAALRAGTISLAQLP
jgi:hypothetical protein